MIDLPEFPGPTTLTWTPIDFGGTVQGVLGGSAQRVNRLGNRWKLGIALPPMAARDANTWAAALVRGLRLGVRYAFVQPDFSTGGAGSPLVNGAGQAGATLALDGLTPNSIVRAGQFVSLVSGGQRFVHQIATAARVSGTGTLAAEIEPPLRVSPADNDVVEFAAPKIEGLLADVPEWAITVDRLVHGLNFAIVEMR